MKKTISVALTALVFTTFALQADFLYTVDGKVYEGKMVAFKYNVIFFNIYKFGKYYSKRRFPLYEIWKIEFNTPRKEGMLTPVEMEDTYKKWRRGKRTRKISLDASQDWVDTGINLKIGQDVLFEVEGSIQISPDTRVFPDGELELTLNRRKPISNQPTGAVIARVGERGEPFYVGNDKAPFHMSRSGRLYLGINDFTFSDNSGVFSVTIYY